MKLEDYNRILDDYHQLEERDGKNASKLNLERVAQKHNLCHHLVCNIVLFDHRYRIKQIEASLPRLNWTAIYDEWDKGASVQEVADRHKLDAIVVLRNLVLRHKNFNRDEMKSLMRDSNLCEDGRLAFEMERTQLRDVLNGNVHSHINHVHGMQFEAIVRRYLALHNVSYRSEVDLRQTRYDVTPDFLLNVPLILIQTRSNLCLAKLEHAPEEELEGETSRSVINWMECKASFGSIESHRVYYDQQYFPYRNRFGPGLVLYSLGFIDEMPQNLLAGIALTQEVPCFLSSKSSLSA